MQRLRSRIIRRRYMQDTSAVKYRIKFIKDGALRYISHLDVMRYFQKVFKRADLPVKYSEGFSPHQLLSFAYPLSLGYTSEGEYLDIVLTEEVNIDDALRTLNEVSSEGLKIRAIKKLPEKAPNCMSSVFAASYDITVRQKISLCDDFVKKSIDFLSQETIPVNKPKKKGGGFLSMDLKKYIYDFRFVDDRTLYILLNSGSETNIRPDFVMDLLCNNCGIELSDNPYEIHRIDIYENASSEEGRIELRTLI